MITFRILWALLLTFFIYIFILNNKADITSFNKIPSYTYDQAYDLIDVVQSRFRQLYTHVKEGTSKDLLTQSKPDDLGNYDREDVNLRADSDLMATRPDYCWPHGQIEAANCNYDTVETFNLMLFPLMHELVETSLFRYWRVNLNRDCPFWIDEAHCILKDCSVIIADESQIPDKWKMTSLSSVRQSNDLLKFTKDPYCNIRNTDFCIVDGDDQSGDGVFVDLVQNPERFTGYGGESSHRIWSAIYNENCFDLVPSLFNKDALSFDEDVCMEKKAFYRLISGLHSSISIHICNEWLDRTTGVWSRNMTCFEERFKNNKPYIENLYFAYTILLRSITKLVPFLNSSSLQSMCSVDSNDVGVTLDLISQISNSVSLPGVKNMFNEKLLFKEPDTDLIFDEFKLHFRNISKIMDCVSCEKCRLWGKVQVTGIGTALKILFSFADDKVPTVSRSELVALFNTMHRFSESIYTLFKLSVDGDEKVTHLPFVYDRSFSDVLHDSGKIWEI